MSFKMGSIVMALMLIFIAKISLESATGDSVAEKPNYRTMASIDQNYQTHISAD